MPYFSSAPAQSGFVSQSDGRPHFSWSWTAARSLILVRPALSAVSWRTTKALVSSPGVMPRTVRPFDATAAWSAVWLAAPSPLILVCVVEAETRPDVLGHEVDLARVHGRDALLARAEAELALDGVARVLEHLGIDLAHQLRLVEVVGADPDRRPSAAGQRCPPERRRGRRWALVCGWAAPPVDAGADSTSATSEGQHAASPHVVLLRGVDPWATSPAYLTSETGRIGRVRPSDAIAAPRADRV